VTVASSSPDTAGKTSRPGVGRGFRADIEGLRAIAIGLVVAYHAGVPGVTGGFVGVDVFFVLSGFLITGMLVDEVARTGSISISGFYARRIRRLLPQSTLVLLSTAAASLVLLDPLARSALAHDVGWAALYGANWNYATQLTDYMASGVAKSPLLHFWSLGVEEQFYLIWPVLALCVLAVLRRVGSRSLDESRCRRWFTAALLLVTFVSLSLSVLTTSESGPWAYYGLHTRAWELAAGGLLALGRARWPSIRAWVRGAAGWLGMAAVLVSAVAITPQTAFPGVAAVLPVGGTVLLVFAGSGPGVRVSGLLANPVLGYIGRVSYAWYLWHWPCLVLLDALPDEPGSRSWLWTLAVVATSLVLAVATGAVVENPVRHSTWLARVRRRSLLLGVVLTLVSVLAGGALGTQSRHAAQEQTVTDGAQAMTPQEADADKVTGLSGCHVGFGATTVAPAADCTFGDPQGDYRVALIGDSHAEHWFPALERVAEQRHWSLTLWTKDTCPAIDAHVWVDVYKRPYPECDRWQDSLYEQLRRSEHFDLLVVGASWKYVSHLMDGDRRLYAADTVEAAWAADTLATLPRLTAVADRVVLLRDGPRAPSNVPRCLSEHDDDPAACAFTRAGHVHLDEVLYAATKDALADYGRAAPAARPRVQVVDPTPLICGINGTCPVVTPAGLIIYRDDSHLTQTFSTSIGKRFADLMGAG